MGIIKEAFEVWLYTMKNNYKNFNGVATKREFWLFLLIQFIILFVLGIATSIINFLSILTGIFNLLTLLPGLGITVRRLKDIGKPWHWIFVSVIPVLGGIYLLYLCSQPSVEVKKADEIVNEN